MIKNHCYGKRTNMLLTLHLLQELTQKEAEYISLSRDTTETDLKQRREIRDGTAFHIDQVCV